MPPIGAEIHMASNPKTYLCCISLLLLGKGTVQNVAVSLEQPLILPRVGHMLHTKVMNIVRIPLK